MAGHGERWADKPAHWVYVPDPNHRHDRAMALDRAHRETA